ncbi:hypothetical protein GCM10025868_39490 [Angustibacter aerolatus]|uniref:Uncharacterized protein n=1 Tax=Angustibacter aerolatus TaxID=1162965 RepID=A0ABQ6JNK6_9ACTN|nr:hypothetical protein GCM10025868_39490 [Angustibacter aerolatus]
MSAQVSVQVGPARTVLPGRAARRPEPAATGRHRVPGQAETARRPAHRAAPAVRQTRRAGHRPAAAPDLAVRLGATGLLVGAAAALAVRLLA